MTAVLLRLRRFADDVRAITITEFAIILPVMLTMIMGLGDILYQMYAQELLAGAIQKVARDSTIQGAAQQSAQLDDKVMVLMANVMAKPAPSCVTNPPAGTFCSTRKSYAMFSAAGPEPFTDTNGDNIRQPGECYLDMNNNGSWDANPGPGVSGQGGASDVTLYAISITYKHLFPVASLLGWGSTQTISAQTLLKNQPYASRNDPTVVTKCN